MASIREVTVKSPHHLGAGCSNSTTLFSSHTDTDLEIFDPFYR